MPAHPAARTVMAMGGSGAGPAAAPAVAVMARRAAAARMTPGSGSWVMLRRSRGSSACSVRTG